MIALALSLIATCPPGVDSRACSKQDACVAEVRRASSPAEGVTVREAALVSRLRDEHACALAGWSIAVSSSVALALPLVPPPVPICPPAPECLGTFATTALTVGACALCGGASLAACRVVP